MNDAAGHGTQPGHRAGVAVHTGRPRYRVRPYQAGDEHGIQDLFHRVWCGSGLPGRSMAQWRWQFQDAPLGHRTVVAEDDAGDIIGHYSGVPLRITCAGHAAVGTHCLDSMVDPRARRGLKRPGVFATTASAYYRAWGDTPANAWNWGFPNRSAARVGRLLGYVTLCDAIPAVHFNLYHREDPQQFKPARGEALQARPVAEPSGEVDELWQRLVGSFPFAVVRDRAYLAWRYVASPTRYTLLEVRDDRGLRGVAVTRPGWTGAPILAVVDYLADPSDTACLSAVLAAALAEARAAEQARVELWLPSQSATFRDALRLGFRVEPSRCITVCRPPSHITDLDWHLAHWHYAIGDSDIV